MIGPMALQIAQDADADRVLTDDPFALLTGMLLDQQFPMERAFAGPAKVLERFGGQWGAELHLRAGIDLGEASSGLVGRAHVVYDLWGEAVNLAFRIQSEHPETGIFVTERVSARLPATVALSDAGVVLDGRDEVRIWRVDGAGSGARDA